MLRGLGYIRETPEIADTRLDDPVALLEGRRRPNGRWVTDKRMPWLEHFGMEKWGGESRWVTLKTLRILKARDAARTGNVT